MEKNKRLLVIKMRSSGNTHSEIANALDMPIGTVRSICSRAGLTYVNDEDRCKKCGNELIQSARGRKKKFCDNVCRREWWNINENKINKKAYYKRNCLYCGRAFEKYGRPDAKYCSHTCYIARRYHGDQ